jgi:hypothetical protein
MVVPRAGFAQCRIWSALSCPSSTPATLSARGGEASGADVSEWELIVDDGRAPKNARGAGYCGAPWPRARCWRMVMGSTHGGERHAQWKLPQRAGLRGIAGRG